MDDENYMQSKAGHDINLTSKDQELNFEKNDEEEVEREFSSGAVALAKEEDEKSKKDEDKANEDEDNKMLKELDEDKIGDLKKGEKTIATISKKPTGGKGSQGRIKVNTDMDLSNKENSLTPVNTNIVAPTGAVPGPGVVGVTGANSGGGGQISSKVPLKTIDELLIHTSDTAVKPIIGNKDIEKQVDLIFNP